MSSDFAIRAHGLGKCYQIYKQPLDRLKQSFWRARRRLYQEFWALRDISFEIKKGETVGIIGSNGAGKSTLLQLICGTLNPSVGELHLNGRVAALLELGSGFNPDFTGRENVYMNAAIMGLTRAEIDSRYDSIVAFANIGQFINQPVKTYSSGMYVRLAFATAISVSPDILVIDEALAVGDVRFQQKCMAAIKKFCQTGTVIFVSHDTAAVIELCSRVLWIDGGRIRMEGDAKFVSEKYLQYMYEGDAELQTACMTTAFCSENALNLSQYTIVDKDIRQFGNGHATIEAVRILSQNVNSGVIYSGRECEISVVVRLHKRIDNPIVGYVVRDRLGRDVLGDNTALIGKTLSSLSAHKRYAIIFKIDLWPNLIEGDYTVCFGVADGTVEDHVQCHVLYDALVIKSIPVRPPTGFFSVINTQVTFVEMDD
jgi:lipopolysaccharide transport system ATP-binding protein